MDPGEFGVWIVTMKDQSLLTSAATRERELPLFKVEAESPNVEWLVGFLQGRDWIRAADILREIGREPNENEKRKVRAWADASNGRVCGHQKGYKLTTTMTHEEYVWWRNELLKTRAAIDGRLVETDRVFYGRKAA